MRLFPSTALLIYPVPLGIVKLFDKRFSDLGYVLASEHSEVFNSRLSHVYFH
jgi:hypothetical protein